MTEQMKNKVIVILILFLFSQIISAQTWQKVEMNFPPEDSTLQYNYALSFFPKKNIGWINAVGPFNENEPVRKIFKTIDGGKTWSLKYSDDFWTRTFYYALDSNHCWASGQGNMLFTQDGGETWKLYRKISNNIHFFDEGNGIALSEQPWFTSDGGISWNAGDSLPYHIGKGVTDITFVNRRLGWAVMDRSPDVISVVGAGAIANTIDSGKTWNYQERITTQLWGVEFIDSLVGFAVGGVTGGLYSTQDGGENWVNKEISGSGPLFDVGFLNKKIGWVTGESGKIWQTNDGGETWNEQNTGVEAAFTKIFVLREEKAAYVFGGKYVDANYFTNPFVLLTIDLSELTQVGEEKKLPRNLKLMQNYPNPFNPITSIKYKIPESSVVTLTIYDMLGRTVEVLVSEKKEAGEHNVVWNASGYSSGIFIAKLKTENFIDSIKLIYLK